jgi:ribose/xylose/arabinose/galactoside ABC-type transport system permease subunit
VNSNAQSVVKGLILLIVVALDSLQVSNKKTMAAAVEGKKESK